MEKKTVIVIGATGNLGAYISVRLKNDGYNVVAVGGRPSDNGFFAAHGMTYLSMDIRKKEEFDKLPKENVFAVAHFAGSLPSRYAFDPQDLIDSVTRGTLNVLEYMRSVDCKRIVFPQSPHDISQYLKDGKPLTPDLPRSFPMTGDHSVYVIAKNAACDLIEHYHAQFGFKHYILRFFTIYQYHPNPYHYADFKKRMMPYRMLMERAMNSLPIEIWGDSSIAKEIVYVKDLARLVSICLASNHDGGFYNVGNGWQVSLDDQIKGIIEVFSPKDNPSPIIYCPEKPNPRYTALDITKLQQDFGYKPQYSYLEQLRDFKHEMETEPFAQLWGRKDDYTQ